MLQEIKKKSGNEKQQDFLSPFNIFIEEAVVL